MLVCRGLCKASVNAFSANGQKGPDLWVGRQSRRKLLARAMVLQSGSACRATPVRGRQSPPRLTEKLDGAGATGEDVCRTMREPEKDRSIGDTKENYGGTRHNNTLGRACACISCKFKV